MGRTLYVSDLDGTLLLPSQVVSNFTADAINKLTSKGMLFSYATARSLETSAKPNKSLASLRTYGSA